MWRDDLQIAVSNAVQEGATIREVADYLDDCVLAFDWPKEEEGM